MSLQPPSTIGPDAASRRRKLEALLRKKVEASRSFPVSFAQQRLLVLERLDPGNPAYNIPLAIRLTGELDLEALRRTLQAVIARHQSLRTRFVETDDEPVQVIDPMGRDVLSTVDLEPIAPDLREAEALSRAEAEARTPFRLDQSPLFRVTLLRLSAREHLVVIVIHHIISDEWSMRVLLREVMALYEAFRAGRPSPLPDLPIQYPDYTLWQRGRLQGDTLRGLVDYWRGRLQDVPALDLPVDPPEVPVPQSAGATETVCVPRQLAEPLRELARREGATLYMILLAAFQVLMGRHAGQQDFAVGSPIAGRLGKETEGLVGFFVNAVALRADLSGAPTFRQLLARVRNTALEAFRHQELPFDMVVDALKPERNAHRHPVFQVSFSLENAPWPDLHAAGLRMSVMPLDTRTAKFDLSFSTRDGVAGVEVTAEYSTSLFRKESVQRLLRRYEVLLEGIIADPNQPVTLVPILDPVEHRQILVDWSRSQRELRFEPPVTEQFRAQVARTPDALAVVDGSREWTYRELDERSSQLAHALRARGVGTETLVAVRLRRSAELIATLWGVLKAGGAYLPLDPQWPAERVRQTLADANAEVLVTEQALPGSEQLGARQALFLDADRQELERLSTVPPPGPVSEERLAYVIYTSGSTGGPKGVMIEHRALSNYTAAAAAEYGITSGDRVLQFASASFDAHVEEVYPCLTRGGTLVLRTDEMLDGQRFLKLCDEWRLTFVTLPTGFWHELTAAIEAEDLEVPVSLRTLVIGGEKAQPERVAAWFRCAGERVRLFNTYGPTETTVVATAAELSGEEARNRRAPIGRPMSNTRAYVLDRTGQPVPAGVRGELYLGGESVARGYLNRPELTRERFLADPFAERPDARMYRTGDVVRWARDGQLEFLGRTDAQVKLRGFRVEPGEVEQVLCAHSGVADAAVLVRERTPGDQHLVAYVGTRRGSDLSATDLRQFLRQRLPEYLVPTAFVLLEALPRNTSGKLDRRALPEPSWNGEAAAGNHAAPRTPVEQQLAAIWSELLGVEQVGLHDNFFDLGGNSLLAMRMIPRLRKAFSLDLPLGEMFREPTLSGLARQIAAARTTSQTALPEISRATQAARAPASYGQEELWTVHHALPGPSPYAHRNGVRLEGPLETAALKGALDDVWRRHDILRTTFADTPEGVMQIVSPHRPLTLPVVDLSELSETERAARLARHLDAETRGRFDLEKGPLVQIELLRLGPEEHVLVIGMHHIVYDGWSLTNLSRELLTSYLARVNGHEPELPTLPIQYTDFARWQRERLQGEVLARLTGYWRTQLQDLPDLNLHTDRPRPTVRTTHGAECRLQVSRAAREAVHRFCQQAGVTPFMMLMAGLQVLLCQSSGQCDFAIGTAVAGRLRPETEPLIGDFINDLVIRADLSGQPTFRDLVGRVRNTVLQAFEYQELPFVRLVRELRPVRSPGRHPLIQTEFIFHNTPTDSWGVPGMRASWVGRDKGGRAADLDLSFEAEETAEGLDLSVTYRTDLFQETTAFGLLNQWRLILEGAVAEPDAPLTVEERSMDTVEIAVESQRPAAPARAPTTEAERQIARMWCGLLGIDTGNVHESFFDAGGDSLLAVRLLIRIRQEFQVALTAADFLSEPTIAGIARRVESAWPREPASPCGSRTLVTLQSGGPGRPLFCIHGLGGHVVGFTPLARGLGGTRPVFAFQGHGLMAGQTPHDRIEAMGMAYVAELRTVQPCGPYSLLGWSMGGWVALEAARRLTADGEKIEHLVLLDSYPRIPSSAVLDPEEQSVLSRIAPQVQLSFDDLRPLPLEQQWARIRERAEQLEGVEEIRRLAAVCQAHVAAIAAYRPAVYPGPVLLLEAELGCASVDPLWNSLCPKLRVERVPGNHYSMLRPPHVDGLIKVLRRCLSEAEVRH